MRRRLCVFAEVRVTAKHRYGSASVAVRAEKRAIKSDKLIVFFSETETAKQNQKFPFHFFFRFAVEGWGGRRREENARKFFGFCTRESTSVSEAHSPRNRSVRGSLEPPRARRVRLVFKILRILSEIHSNFVQYTPQRA
jgi:hypothetical protein